MAEAGVAKQELLEQEREAVEQASSTTKSMAGAQTSKTQSFTSGSFARVVVCSYVAANFTHRNFQPVVRRFASASSAVENSGHSAQHLSRRAERDRGREKPVPELPGEGPSGMVDGERGSAHQGIAG